MVWDLNNVHFLQVLSWCGCCKSVNQYFDQQNLEDTIKK